MMEAEEIQVLRSALKESAEERDLLRSKLGQYTIDASAVEKLLCFVTQAGDRACTEGRCVSCGRGGFDHTGKDLRVATTFAGQCKNCCYSDRFGLEVLRRSQWKKEAAAIAAADAVKAKEGSIDADPK